jgi:hypothetical protein
MPGSWAAEDRTAMHINKTTRTGFVLIITFSEQYRVLDASEILVGSLFEFCLAVSRVYGSPKGRSIYLKNN